MSLLTTGVEARACKSAAEGVQRGLLLLLLLLLEGWWVQGGENTGEEVLRLLELAIAGFLDFGGCLLL